MKRMTKKAFYDKAINLARRHGEVIIHFEQRHDISSRHNITYMRRRKIRHTGDCYVSYLDSSDHWTRYHTSCFVVDVRPRSIDDTIKRLRRHDRSSIQPLLIEYGKGKNKKKIEFMSNELWRTYVG